VRDSPLQAYVKLNCFEVKVIIYCVPVKHMGYNKTILFLYLRKVLCTMGNCAEG